MTVEELRNELKKWRKDRKVLIANRDFSYEINLVNRVDEVIIISSEPEKGEVKT